MTDFSRLYNGKRYTNSLHLFPNKKDAQTYADHLRNKGEKAIIQIGSDSYGRKCYRVYFRSGG